VTLALSQYVLPETLYPWLNLLSGLLVVVVGATVLRSQLRRRTRTHTHHQHGHDYGHDHDHLPQKSLLAMGAAAGLIPCPSALVVLLGAVAQGQIALGMLLIVAFSLGLAMTLTGLGLAVVLAAKAVKRLRVPGALVTALPAASALLIVFVGCVLTAKAIPLIS
jgi:nickel/cobalt exporter